MAKEFQVLRRPASQRRPPRTELTKRLTKLEVNCTLLVREVALWDNARAAVAYWSKKLGRRFVTRLTDKGVEIGRTS